jgi:hypothetical protein
MLQTHMEKNAWSWRGWLGDLEEAARNKGEAEALGRANAALTADLTTWKAAVTKWQKAHDDLKRQLALSQGLDWIGRHRTAIVAGFAVPVIALIGWLGYQRWIWPADVDNGLRQLATHEAWRPGYGDVVVRVIAGKPYWVLAFGDTDTSGYATAQGTPIGMNCVHLYAAPATEEFGRYVVASPFLLWGWWRKWPERSVDCRSFSFSAGLGPEAGASR